MNTTDVFTPLGRGSADIISVEYAYQQGRKRTQWQSFLIGGLSSLALCGVPCVCGFTAYNGTVAFVWAFLAIVFALLWQNVSATSEDVVIDLDKSPVNLWTGGKADMEMKVVRIAYSVDSVLARRWKFVPDGSGTMLVAPVYVLSAEPFMEASVSDLSPGGYIGAWPLEIEDEREQTHNFLWWVKSKEEATEVKNFLRAGKVPFLAG